MCTLSIISTAPGAFRIVMNRDEELTRAAAIAPAWRDLPAGAGRALFPTDPQGGGTWIACVNAAAPATTSGSSLFLAVMNGNPDPRPPLPSGAQTRGNIIPRLITESLPTGAAPDVWTTLARARELPLNRFAPFRLVALSRVDWPATEKKPARLECKLGTLTWNGKNASEDLLNPALPRCFASSGLGDALVQCRLPLFAESVTPAPAAAAQDAFHAHQWPDRRHLSVLMTREDARTVSVTRVEVGAAGVEMTYATV